MKLFLLALIVAVTTAAPLPPNEQNADPVELIVNGVPDGEPLEIGDIVDIKLKHHVDGQIASVSDLLYPLTAQGIADSVAAEESSPGAPDASIPIPAEPLPELEPVILPEPVLPGVVPESVELPAPVLPVVVPEQPVIEPEIVEEPIVEPTPIEEKPEVIEAPQIPNGEIFNDGNVQVSLNVSNESGIIPTIQSWLQILLNYFHNGVQTTQQIV
ncbi:unnamed protein product, partial [Iphiclides podalirius]